jgi:hypothetical protein
VFDFWQGQDIFLYSAESRPALEFTKPSIQRVPGAVSSEIKRLRREADHSSPSSGGATTSNIPSNSVATSPGTKLEMSLET